jgi:dipeptidyl aminopeptidase/acylaminoacyl peptidase
VKDVAIRSAPDGKSVAFVVSQIDVKEDKPSNGHIWTVGIDGQNERQITSSTDSESSPKFSPDSKYCLHLIASGEAKETGVAAGPRRRSISAHRDKGRLQRCFVGAGLEAVGADDWRSGS